MIDKYSNDNDTAFRVAGLLLAIVAVITLATLNAKAATEDQKLHAVSSYALSTTVYSSLHSNTRMSKPACLISAALATLLVGYAKERTDPIYDVGDMNANLGGVSIGLMFPIIFKF